MKVAKRILTGLTAVFAVVLSYLIAVIFLPILEVPPQPIARRRKGQPAPPPPCRHDVSFAVDGTTVRAWLYLPTDPAAPVPCVVMSTGFAGTKDALLEQYALRFIAADQIVLWGTSAAGGYGLVIAGEDARVAAVISQAAGLDHDADSKLYLEHAGLGHLLRVLVHAQRDKGRGRLGLSPHMIPAVGRPGTLAMHVAPGAFDGYAALVADSETFKNEVCPRLLLAGHGPDATQAAAQVRCPVLMLICEQDNLAAPHSHREAAEALGDLAEVRTYPIGHFDIYQDVHFERAMGDQLAFLLRCLGRD